MLLHIIFINILCVFLNCSENNITQIDINTVELIISSSQNEVKDSLLITVILKNKTGTDFSILNSQDVSMSNNPVIVWNLEILYKDSILKISPIHFFVKLHKPLWKDYSLVKNGNDYIFNFIVDMNILVRSPLEFSNENEDIGEYTLRLTYKDPFCNIKNAFKDQIESNLINITFKK